MTAAAKKMIESSIPDMSIGEERKCLNQIYRAARVSPSQAVDPNWLLFNGQTAGVFCTKYVVGHYNKRKLKEAKKNNACTPADEQEEGAQESEEPEESAAETQDVHLLQNVAAPLPETPVKAKRSKRGHGDKDEATTVQDDDEHDKDTTSEIPQKKGRSSRKKVDKNLDAE
jgi:hypothetical protein